MREFFEAIQSGNAARVGELLAAQPALAAARSDTGVSAIMLAMYYGRQAIRDLLLAAGAELDIWEAAAAGRTERVAALLREDPGLAGAYAPDGFTPLGLAAFFGQRSVVELLLARGAEANTVSRNATGYTALTGAVARGHTEIVAALLAAGANAAHRYAAGYTPLHEAAGGGRLEIAKLLLARGADPNARTDDGKTPLATALEMGHSELAALLRQHGATA